ncbi:alpha-ketoacid dehydrogenase subunit alpha/beta [Sediminibacterium ginsengisoli]|uniref:2-oxoisovalerate dehydrogenase E1 component n=1 Tax=Sediminibacterium ginsengisoli TaxID=413434 RepID=A0A1T4NK39_9BACT|nr:dehydrogenase E1 component subunit alpha/beta [Sediminibacterium ginsengisoli]SJZ79630.1 2-oxoisovalerate dehydrogenase E1 component [Sediminibacterium ginsengisoli]
MYRTIADAVVFFVLCFINTSNLATLKTIEKTGNYNKQTAMEFVRSGQTNDELVFMYRSLLLPRMIEEKMLVLLRQGKISKWFSGIGQEAISVGSTLALEKDEWVMPLHRNLGVFTTRQMGLQKLFMQWQGNKDGYSKGRERSFHFGSRAHHICGMISHLGPQLALADGVALAYKLRKDNKVSLAYSGDGGTSEGDFHEALNVAAVWGLPVIFVIENNGYGLSTPVNEQYKCESLVDKAKGYGMDGIRINGNNILEVYDTIRGVRDYCIRNQKPYLVECMTFRMRGHEEASGTKYVPAELFDEWGAKDPVKNYEAFLLAEGVLTAAAAEEIRSELKTYIEEELKLAYEAEELIPDANEELHDVYAKKSVNARLWSDANTMDAPKAGAPEKRFVDAIQEGLSQSMQLHDNLVLMGQDIAEYGGAFKITEGFVKQFGKERVRNTPLCESAIVGTALGLSLEGYKSMMEMQFADFVTVGFNQIVNNLAKIHYRWGQQADVVIRMPTGGGVGAGPFHSQSNEAWFTHVPGLKVVYPSTPHDAKGLLIAAINDPNPVLFFEHKGLYRSVSGPVPEAAYEVEIGKARLAAEGTDITVITYGSGVHWALEYQHQHPEVSLHILDLRTLLPLDYEAVRTAVAKTGKVLLLHEDTLTGGIGGEISAWISEHCFELLDAPVMRCASLDTPVPFNIDLEKTFMAKNRLHGYVEKLQRY